MKILRLRIKWPPTPSKWYQLLQNYVTNIFMYDRKYYFFIKSCIHDIFLYHDITNSNCFDRSWSSYIYKNLISKYKYQAIFVFISRPSDSCQKNFVKKKRKYQSCTENINYHCITTNIYENMNILCVICSILLLNILHDIVDVYVYGY